MAVKIFGFEFGRSEKSYLKNEPASNQAISFVDRDSESTAAVIASSFTSGMFLDMQGTIKAEADLVTKYRDMCTQAEIDNAVDEISNEAITTEEDFIVKLDLSKINILDDNAKRVLQEFHEEILEMLDFNSKAYWIFRRWYVDGRLYYHAVTDPAKLQEGIKELRYIDPRKIREIKEVAPKRIDGGTEMNQVGAVHQTKTLYYLYNDRGFAAKAPYQIGFGGMATQGVRISKDSVVHVPSGLSDTNTTMGLGYLTKAIKILSQLKTIEDSLVIYRLARAPERRVWYVDVGNLPPVKADQQVRDIMINQKNKLIYDAETGAIQDSRKFLCYALDTKIPLLDGRTLELHELIKEYKEGKLNWAYSCDPKSGRVSPGPISWAGITKNNSEVVKITFDNGKSVVVTPDHKFPVWEGGFIEAKDLLGRSIIPGYRRMKKIGKYNYEQIYLNDEKRWEFTHRVVSEWKDENKIENEFVFNDPEEVKIRPVIHHKDFNRFNNSPDNLSLMGFYDHFAYHGDNANKTFPRSKKFYEERSNNINWQENIKKARKDQKNRFTKSWKITTPEGEQFIIDNLNQFCRDHDLNRSNIKYKTSRGYKAEKLYNHKVISVEVLPYRIDVGCITIDLNETYHSNHTYLLDCGVYGKNTMTEDYWLPRRADGSGTRVETLPAGQTLGQIDDIVYFQKLLYNSLNVPIERLQADPFDVGNGSEITRSEVKFSKFVKRLQAQFSLLFRDTLKKQCVLRGIMSLEEFELIERQIKYIFAEDNHWSALKDQTILGGQVQAYAGLKETGVIGTYVSHNWVRRNIFQQTADDMAKQDELIMQEMQNPIYNQPTPEEQQAQADNEHEAQIQDQEQSHETRTADQESEENEANRQAQEDADEYKALQDAIKAVMAIPVEKRTPGDNNKLRSLSKQAASLGKGKS